MFLRELGSKVTESLREIVEQDFIVIEHAPIYGLAPPPRRSKKLLTVEDYLNYVDHPINLTSTHTIHHIIDKKWDKLKQAIFIHGLKIAFSYCDGSFGSSWPFICNRK